MTNELAEIFKGKTFLTDRREIAKAINIDKIPVIVFDLTNPMEGYDNCYEGTKVNIEGAHRGAYADLSTHCTPHIWGDELKGDAILCPWLCDHISLNCLNKRFVSNGRIVEKGNNVPYLACVEAVK